MAQNPGPIVHQIQWLRYGYICFVFSRRCQLFLLLPRFQQQGPTTYPRRINEKAFCESAIDRNIEFKIEYFYRLAQQIVLQQPHQRMNLAQSIDSPACKLTAPKTLDFRIKYKTQKCRYWQQQGYCPYGQMCAFVHDQLEKRYKGQIHEHYKTKPCSNFSKNCYCKYGDRCLFLHGQNCTDRERTRSNSPAEDQAAPKAPGKHQQNLKMLAEFGLSVFQAYMQRSHSYVLSLRDAEQCNWSSSSTEPDMLNNQFYGHNYYFMGDELVDHSLHAQERKSRMYSL